MRRFRFAYKFGGGLFVFYLKASTREEAELRAQAISDGRAWLYD
jgi:hypothetical protein